MNFQISEIVEEVCLFDNSLSHATTLEEFIEWCEVMRGQTKEWFEDHPNFKLYAKSPAFYWPHIQKYLRG